MKPRRLTRSMTTLHRNSFPIPDELVFEIYSRLPLNSIARCRCVCKLWSSMLRRQDFTDFFFTKSCARPRIFFACKDDKKITFSSSPQPQNLEGNNSYAVAANHLASFHTCSRFFGCTNGFFLYHGERIFKGLKGVVTAPLIGKPSTGQSLTLPRSKRGERRTYLLGYDPTAKEFKVLSMACQRVENVCISVDSQVLTLGTKRLSWRKGQCCIPHSPSPKSICIGGVLYYICREVCVVLMEEVKVSSCGFYVTLQIMNGPFMFTCYLLCGKMWLQIPCVLLEWLVRMKSYCLRATKNCIHMSSTTVSRVRRSRKLESEELETFRVGMSTSVSTMLRM